MEVQLQELIEKIKKDGVLAADEKAAEIIKAAEKKAQDIITDAEQKAEAAAKKAEAEAQRFEKAAGDSVKQASRNTLIAFRQGILKQVEAIINAETKKAYTADLLKNLIPEAVKNWAKATGSNDLSVILSDADAKDLQSALASALKDTVSGGVEIKSDNRMSGGFKIGTKDGVAYYDFSAEAIAEIFASYLSPKTAEILKEAAKEV